MCVGGVAGVGVGRGGVGGEVNLRAPDVPHVKVRGADLMEGNNFGLACGVKTICRPGFPSSNICP